MAMDQKGSRKNYTKEEVAILQEAFPDPTAPGDKETVTSIAIRIGRSAQQIKEWVRNRKKKRNPKRKRPLYVKGVSAYNAFCRATSLENNAENNATPSVKFQKWSEMWRSLSKEQKEEWAQISKRQQLEVDVKQKRKHIIKKIHNLCEELDSCDTCVLVHSGDNQVTSFGTGNGVTFLTNSLETDFIKHLDRQNRQVPAPPSTKEIRTKVRMVLNRKYSEAIGAKRRLPYAQLGSKVIIRGLPFSIKKGLNQFGAPKLQMILDAEENITVEVISNDQGPNPPGEQDPDEVLEDQEYDLVPTTGAEDEVLEDQEYDIVPTTGAEDIDLLNVLVSKQENEDKEQTKANEAKSELYNIKAILRKKKQRGQLKYLVHWEGYPESESTWEPLSRQLAKSFGF